MGLVHDIGKIGVPVRILNKAGRLTPAEYEQVKSHSQFGFDILDKLDFGWPVAECVLQHHERLDGSGYPRALKAQDIFFEARILAVADVIDAMSEQRTYRPARHSICYE
jgi:HD-GYP domain-containing protein (c-di-GMP phosphodiesterase class II)